MKKVNSVEHRKMADGSHKTTKVGETKRGVPAKEVTVRKWNAEKNQRETHIVETFGKKGTNKPKSKVANKSTKRKTSNKKKSTNKSKKSKK